MTTPSSGKLWSLVPLILGVCFLSGGYALLTFWGRPLLETARASSTWPTTPGKITESKVVIESGNDSTTYRPHIVYRYAVDDLEIFGDRVWLGVSYSSSNRSEHQQVVTKYPVGKEVTVYYDPDDVFTSVLEPGVVFSSYLGMIISWVLLLIGSAALLVPMAGWLKLRQRDRGPETFTIEGD